MSRIEEVKKCEDRLRELAEQIIDLSEELKMSVHLDTTYCEGLVIANASLFDFSEDWYRYANIATRNKDFEDETDWEVVKRGGKI